MSNLTKFLLARIAEDEAVARAAGEPPWDEWRYDDGGEVYHAESLRNDPDNRGYLNGVTCDSEGLSPSVTEEVGRHVSRHDPARVLAECAAKRHQLDEALVWGEGCLDVIARYMAEVYAEHADYREEWRP